MVLMNKTSQFVFSDFFYGVGKYLVEISSVVVLSLCLIPLFIIGLISNLLLSHLVTQSQIFLWKEEETVLLLLH